MQSLLGIEIFGTGYYAPPQIITNLDYEKKIRGFG